MSLKPTLLSSFEEKRVPQNYFGGQIGVYLLGFPFLHFPEVVSFLIAPLWGEGFGDQRVPCGREFYRGSGSLWAVGLTFGQWGLQGWLGGPLPGFPFPWPMPLAEVSPHPAPIKLVASGEERRVLGWRLWNPNV